MPVCPRKLSGKIPEVPTQYMYIRPRTSEGCELVVCEPPARSACCASYHPICLGSTELEAAVDLVRLASRLILQSVQVVPCRPNSTTDDSRPPPRTMADCGAGNPANHTVGIRNMQLARRVQPQPSSAQVPGLWGLRDAERQLKGSIVLPDGRAGTSYASFSVTAYLVSRFASYWLYDFRTL
jgi:hypothetical protein